MSLRTCSRKSEVLAMQACGHWPQACPPDLREHLDHCRACAEVLLLKHAFQQQREITASSVQLPAAGAIWWRAQLRRRNAALERVGKPILGAYLFALMTTFIVAAALIGSQARHGLRWLDWLTSNPIPDLHSQSSLLTSTNPDFGLALLIPIFATLVLIGALIVYLAGERQ
jgi:hypothetical protein